MMPALTCCTSRFLLLLLVALMLPLASVPGANAQGSTGSSAGKTAQADPQAQRLASQIYEYLRTPDAGRATELLEAILGNPAASLPRITAILRRGPPYAPQPVGTLPGQPIRMRGRQFFYGLHVPPSYSPTRDYALVLCLHGAGFTGDSYLERWRTRLGENYILACPTMMHGSWWTRLAEELVLATIRTVSARYRIDPDRVFLSGMSNGGIGTWLIGFHDAPTFAGLSPMASGIDNVLFPFLENLRNTPVYIIHGRKDQIMPVELSQSTARRLTELGYPVVYREHDGEHPMAGGHYFPREELPDLIAWLDQQRRDPYPQSLTVVRDASHLKSFGWVRIDATDRIAFFPDNLIEGRDDLILNRIYAKLDARITRPNRIEIRTERVRRYTLFLSEKLVDYSRPVTVLTNGTVSHAGLVEPDRATLLREARLRQDLSALYSSQLTIPVEEPGKGPAPGP